MPIQPTTLSSVASLIGETLTNHYGVDPAPLYEQAGIDPARLNEPEARYPRERIMALWDAAIEATGDPSIGLRVGFQIRPTTYHALGYAWLASDTLLEALQRLQRYVQVIVTVPLELTLELKDSNYMLGVRYTDPEFPMPAVPLDSFLASIVKLCRSTSSPDFDPVAVWVKHDALGCPEVYAELFEAPVTFNAETNALFFDKAAMEAPLPGRNLILADSNDRIAQRYIDSLDHAKVASQVRQLLLDMLPSGAVSQTAIAQRMNRSLSTLQRQLSAEGTTYQTIREQTRQALGEAYVGDNKLAISEIAYLLGFSDQSNFSRAFRRWTGKTPGQYRAHPDD